MSLPKPQIGSTKWLESPWGPSSVTFSLEFSTSEVTRGVTWQKITIQSVKEKHMRLKTGHMEAYYSCDMTNTSRKKQRPGQPNILDPVRSKAVIQTYRFLPFVPHLAHPITTCCRHYTHIIYCNLPTLIPSVWPQSPPRTFPRVSLPNKSTFIAPLLPWLEGWLWQGIGPMKLRNESLAVGSASLVFGQSRVLIGNWLNKFSGRTHMIIYSHIGCRSKRWGPSFTANAQTFGLQILQFTGEFEGGYH